MTEHDPSLDDDFDDDELELEPVDPEVLEHDRLRTLRQARKAEDSVDINEVYDEEHTEDPFELDDFKKIRFSIRHLLIVTALLSIVMTIYTLTDACNAVVVTFMATVGAGWWFVIRQERSQQKELQRRKEKMAARIAVQRAAEDDELHTTPPSPEPEEVSFDPPPNQPSFKFSFSLKQMFGAFTVAALVLGLINFVGGEDNAALLLGSIALLGLALHAAGLDPPHIFVLGWWLLMVLYIVVSIFAALSPDQVAFSTPPVPFESVLALLKF